MSIQLRPLRESLMVESDRSKLVKREPLVSAARGDAVIKVGVFK